MGLLDGLSFFSFFVLFQLREENMWSNSVVLVKFTVVVVVVVVIIVLVVDSGR